MFWGCLPSIHPTSQHLSSLNYPTSTIHTALLSHNSERIGCMGNTHIVCLNVPIRLHSSTSLPSLPWRSPLTASTGCFVELRRATRRASWRDYTPCLTPHAGAILPRRAVPPRWNAPLLAFFGVAKAFSFRPNPMRLGTSKTLYKSNYAVWLYLTIE